MAINMVAQEAHNEQETSPESQPGLEAKSSTGGAKTPHAKIGALTLDTDFCGEALEEALMRFGNPDVFNTDQATSTDHFLQRHNQPADEPLLDRPALCKQTEPPHWRSIRTRRLPGSASDAERTGRG
jgi:hypothetical protein